MRKEENSHFTGHPEIKMDLDGIKGKIMVSFNEKCKMVHSRSQISSLFFVNFENRIINPLVVMEEKV